MSRNYVSRRLLASPPFVFSSPEIASGATYQFMWESQDINTRKYLPFNFFTAHNLATSNDASLYVNQSESKRLYLPHSTSRVGDSASYPAVHGFKIKNEGATALAAGEIVIECQKEAVKTEATIPSLIQRASDILKGGRIV